MQNFCIHILLFPATRLAGCVEVFLHEPDVLLDQQPNGDLLVFIVTVHKGRVV